MKCCFVLIYSVVWLFCSPLFAQKSIQKPIEADSLRRVIATVRLDTVRVNAMNDLSKYFWRVLSRYDSSLVYANVARKTSESIGYRKGVADALYNTGIVYWRQDKYSEALENYFKSLRLYEELSNLIGHF